MKNIGNVVVYYNGTSYIIEEPESKNYISIQLLVKDNKQIMGILVEGNLKDGTPEDKLKKEIEKYKNEKK